MTCNVIMIGKIVIRYLAYALTLANVLYAVFLREKILKSAALHVMFSPPKYQV